MASDFLVKLFEHNLWANRLIIQACSALNDAQLDAKSQSVTKGTIRETLFHLVQAQHRYLQMLTLPVDARTDITPAFSEFQEAARLSGEALLALARDESSSLPQVQRQTRDGYLVAPWVVMVQVINHAHEHREQVCSMLTALGVTPPELDGWNFGYVQKAFVPMSE